jgi:hypothetical protein
MRTNLGTTFSALALCASVTLISANAHAATILKLNLGGTGPDVAMNAAGVFSTVSDGNGVTTGDQNTAIEYTGFLDGLFLDIPTNIASFSMSGVTRTAAPPDVGGGTVTQNFFGGTIKLYDPLNTLLFEANLQDSALIGTIGAPGIGGFFTVTLGSSVPGTVLHPYVVPGSIGLSMPLTNINDGTGLLVLGNVLQPFNSDASVQITANELPIPEPTSVMLVLLATSMSAISFRRRR